MMTLLRFLPFLGIGAAVAYHFIAMDNLNDQVTTLTASNAELNQTIGVLQTAQTTNLATIAGLEDDIETQNTEIVRLETQRNQIASERDRYLSIFSRTRFNTFSSK